MCNFVFKNRKSHKPWSAKFKKNAWRLLTVLIYCGQYLQRIKLVYPLQAFDLRQPISHQTNSTNQHVSALMECMTDHLPRQQSEKVWALINLIGPHSLHYLLVYHTYYTESAWDYSKVMHPLFAKQKLFRLQGLRLNCLGWILWRIMS